jgi:hypothetical protein
VYFPFDLHSVAVFDSLMPCRSPALPRICRSESDLSRPRHSAAWEQHGTCALASAVLRRNVGSWRMAGSRQGRGRVAAGSRHGRGRVAVGEQHENGMVFVNPA